MDLMEYYLECYECDLLAARQAIFDATDDELIEAHIKWFNKDNRHKLEEDEIEFIETKVYPSPSLEFYLHMKSHGISLSCMANN